MDGLEEKKKIVEKITAANFNSIELDATDDEKKWIATYLRIHNATAAVLDTWPGRCKSMAYAKVLGHKLLKKFNCKGKTRKVVRQATHNLKDNTPGKIINHVKDMYLSGAITETELVTRMAQMSSHSLSEATRFAATKELREWLREAQSEIDANRLSMIEIVPLMTSALADLPRDKYIAVLKGCKAKREQLIKERNTVFDADALRKSEKERMINQGINYDLNPGGGDTQTLQAETATN